MTHVTQNTRLLDEEKIRDFVGYINNQIAALEFFSGKNSVNIDEMNINFDMSLSKTSSNRGERTFELQTRGNSNHCTVLLCVTMNGESCHQSLYLQEQGMDTLPGNWDY